MAGDTQENFLESLANGVKTLAENFGAFKKNTTEKHEAFERRIKALEDRPVPKATE